MTSELLDMTPNTGKKGRKQIKVASKDGVKRQPLEQEKKFANDIFNKGLISKIFKENLQFNNLKNNS